MKDKQQLPTTDTNQPAYDPKDPRLIAAAGLLVSWLLETLNDPAQADTSDDGDAA